MPDHVYGNAAILRRLYDSANVNCHLHVVGDSISVGRQNLIPGCWPFARIGGWHESIPFSTTVVDPPDAFAKFDGDYSADGGSGYPGASALGFYTGVVFNT